MTFPKEFRFLSEVKGPRVLVEGLKTYGVREIAGRASNPVILGWARELEAFDPKRFGGLDVAYNSDDIPWCGLWVATVLVRAGWGELVPNAVLSSRAYAAIGEPADKPSLGDILVFWRSSPDDWRGHVGLYVGEDKDHFFVLGGNQSDAVTITRIAKKRLVAARRPKWRTQQPADVKPVIINATNIDLSVNEA